MNIDEKLELLGRAFAYGEVDELAASLLTDCKYNSDYAHRRLTSAEQILESMRNVYTAVRENKNQDSSYTFTIVELKKIFKQGIVLEDLHGDSFFDVYENGMLLYQYGDGAPVAVVYIKYTPGGSISEINLSRNHKWFDLSFYGENGLVDSEQDIPYTVKPMSRHDHQVKELQSAWMHQQHNFEELGDSEVYIWRQSDKYIKQWLKDNGYQVIETQIFDDCIGYRCNRCGYAYTIYMFAYGQERTVQLDGDYCKKLLDNSLSENSTTLVVYLNVKRYKDGEDFHYQVCNYSGDTDRSPELWLVNEVNGKWILEYYPRKEMMDATYRLMYAFNRDNRDVYDCIISEKAPAFNGLEHPGSFMNDAFYGNMFRLHREYGDMKIGYVRFNDVVYSSVPYIEGYGYFSFRVDNATDKIQEVTAFPFDKAEHRYAEFIKTDERESDIWYSDIPAVTSVNTLPPTETERFALTLTFDNGECKKYILPIDRESEQDEVVSYKSHVFTDKIWNSAKIIDSSDPHRGKVISFSNEFFVSVLKCYKDSEAYSEPNLCDEIIYEDSRIKVKRLWTWNVNSIYEDEETGIIKTLISGQAFNYYGISTFASYEGKRLSTINFDYIDNFHDGLAQVSKAGYGYGFVDENMKLVIPMIYDSADEFIDGKAKVRRGDDWFYIDKTGKETPVSPRTVGSKYQDVGEYSEGMCKVSTLKLGFMDLAYHSDYSEIAGTWGFVNEDGVEVVPPQYIYAEDFYGGIAIVCKGKWTIDKKWDNKYNSGRYWTEEEMWGAIDKEGNEVIPFIFDEIKHFGDVDDVFMAHYGGWKDGHWGVIDNQGNWLAEPIFEDIDYEYQDGLFAFYAEDKWNGDDVPLGIYDVKQKRVLFEPQFFDVSFREDGWIEVEVFDEELGRRVEKFIDREGNEKFHSIYSSIYSWKKPYEVTIRDENGNRHGLIDEDGNVILPCEYDVSWNGISVEQKLMVFKEGDKQGIRDFDGNILIEPKFYEIYGLQNPFMTVRVGKKNHYKEGLISRDGTLVIPAEYSRISWCKDNRIICCRDGYCEMLQLITK